MPRGAVVITGASSGIGEACALHLAQLGFRVFAGVRSSADGDRLKAKSPETITPIQVDVTYNEQVRRAAERVATALQGPGLTGLVNNAGIAIAGPIESLPLAEFRRQLEVNLIGQIAVTQAFLPLIRKARGRIVNVGSIAGRSAMPFLGAYACSKFALEALTDALRVEVLPWGISVCIIEPGSIATPIWEKSRRVAEEILRSFPAEARQLYASAYDAMREATRKATSRAIPPDEVARAVAHALVAKKPRTRYVVGKDAKLRLWVERLPDRVRDGIILRGMGMK